ncbi:hypothetical protein N7488_000207 [Penicillium malachiteum]|nr:hypothetical protein N7488_000207 [Penicillium malachiteum]
MTPDPNEIPHSSWNPDNTTTIILIHGAFASSTWWDLVIPHLPQYHILAPDLPGHGKSLEKEFSIQESMKTITQLIRTHAKDSHAHVVGHSLGARVAIHIAETDPTLVDSVFISGYGSLPQTSLTPYLPYAVWMTQRLENLVPRSLIRWAMDGTDIPRIDTRLSTLRLCQSVMTLDETKGPEPWSVRTCIIAAGKGGLVPSADSRSVALRLLEIGRLGNESTVAFWHPDMRHPWNRQDPGLFADSVRAWIEGRALPGGFEMIVS